MMPKSRHVAVIAGALLLGVGGALLWQRGRAQRSARGDHSFATDGGPTVLGKTPGGAPAYSPLADELHAARFDAAHDLVVLRGLLAQFTTTFRPAERPPLGDNADIVAALTGRNRRHIVFLPPSHPALRDGLLRDREGTPYHFHARSADAIDVRSAGPDHVLFTGDDLVSAAPAAGVRQGE